MTKFTYHDSATQQNKVNVADLQELEAVVCQSLLLTLSSTNTHTVVSPKVANTHLYITHSNVSLKQARTPAQLQGQLIAILLGPAVCMGVLKGCFFL